MSRGRGFLLVVIALGGASLAGAARADVPYACWTFEFVPGERVDQPGLGEIQNGRTFYSDEFTITQQPDDAALAEIFETFVRKTVSPVSAKSLYVSGCTGNSASGTAQSNASRGHESRFRESQGRSTNLHWSPSAAELAKGSLPDKDWPPFFMQCIITNGARFYEVDTFYRTAVFPAGHYNTRTTQDELDAWAKEQKLPGRAKCFGARTAERLTPIAADIIDHAKLGSPVTTIAFRPAGAAASATTPKPSPPGPTPAPATAALTVKTDTSIADAARAWDTQVAKALQQEAQQKAAGLAKQAQADAALRAQSEKARQERLKRGRAQ